MANQRVKINTRVIQAVVEVNVAKQLDEIADRFGLSNSAVAGRAIKVYCQEFGKPESRREMFTID